MKNLYDVMGGHESKKNKYESQNFTNNIETSELLKKMENMQSEPMLFFMQKNETGEKTSFELYNERKKEICSSLYGEKKEKVPQDPIYEEPLSIDTDTKIKNCEEDIDKIAYNIKSALDLVTKANRGRLKIPKNLFDKNIKNIDENKLEKFLMEIEFKCNNICMSEKKKDYIKRIYGENTITRACDTDKNTCVLKVPNQILEQNWSDIKSISLIRNMYLAAAKYGVMDYTKRAGNITKRTFVYHNDMAIENKVFETSPPYSQSSSLICKLSKQIGGKIPYQFVSYELYMKSNEGGGKPLLELKNYKNVSILGSEYTAPACIVVKNPNNEQKNELLKNGNCVEVGSNPIEAWERIKCPIYKYDREKINILKGLMEREKNDNITDLIKNIFLSINELTPNIIGVRKSSYQNFVNGSTIRTLTPIMGKTTFVDFSKLNDTEIAEHMKYVKLKPLKPSAHAATREIYNTSLSNPPRVSKIRTIFGKGKGTESNYPMGVPYTQTPIQTSYSEDFESTSVVSPEDTSTKYETLFI